MATLKPHEKFHISRLGLFVLLAVAILLARADSHATPMLAYNKEVLAYATSMSVGDLYAANNASRSANGLAPLQLNNLLNASAQAKAQHMIANNYWAHVAPDGTQPWYFFDLVGYSYGTAGENLAYGFDTGYEVNTAWMNSPSHRANIVGAYQDVGFGIASGPAYQGGEFTVVVAHYGLLRGATPTPAPAPVAPPPAPAAPVAPTPQAPVPPSAPATPSAPAASPIPSTPTDQPNQPTETSPTEAPTESKTSLRADGEKLTMTNIAEPKDVSAFEQLKNNEAPATIVASLSIVGASTAGFALAHRSFMRHLLADGKRFVLHLHHPMLDLLVISISTLLILSTTVGKLL